MTKRWHTAKDYCSDPAGYEAHAKELAGLRRQVGKLAAALQELYLSASILYDTSEADTTTWAINLKKHKEDLARARRPGRHSPRQRR